MTLSTGSRLYGVPGPCAETVAVSLALAMQATVDTEKQNKNGPCVKPVLNWANVSSPTSLEVFGEASWFLIGPPFLREPSWKYSAKLVSS